MTHSALSYSADGPGSPFVPVDTLAGPPYNMAVITGDGRGGVAKYMKQSLIKLIDVLLQRIEENPETTPSETGLRSWLGRKGYSPRDIDAAMKMVGPHVEARIREMGRQSSSVRMFSPSEEYKLSREARDALVRLEYYGLIDAYEREALLERLDHFDGEVGLGELEYLLAGIVYANVDVGSQQIIDDTMLGGSPTYH